MTDKSRVRPRRSGEELAAAWERLLYEIKMLFGTARALHKLNSEGSDERRMWAMRNALVESFSIHARALLGVLYSDEASHDGVLAEDFFDDATTWNQRRPAESATLRALREESNWGIGRLSFVRLDMVTEATEPDIAGMARDLRTALRAFLSLAPGRGISDESRLYALSIMADEIPGEDGDHPGQDRG